MKKRFVRDWKDMASSSATAAFFLDGESDEIVLDALGYILEALNEKINDNYIGSLEIPYTVIINS